MNPKRVILITGLSGSGKSSAARALEDEGFFVVDNLPLTMLTQLLGMVDQESGPADNVAVVVDVRNREFLAGYHDILRQVRDAGHTLDIFFFDAGDEVLIRRYSETRRRHPLGTDGGVVDGIASERRLLSGLRDLATVVIDSSKLTTHQLREKVLQIVNRGEETAPLLVQVQSFGYRYGIPPESDLVLDVRFLPNPHFVPELQPYTGLDPAVSAYVLDQPVCREFLQRLTDLFSFLLPQYRKEGKSYLTISIGCTGGRHRSVAVAEALRPALHLEGTVLELSHRDVAKG